VLDDLVKVGMLKSRRRVIDVKIERIKDSYPIYKRNYPEALDTARRDLAAVENLHLAGRTGLFWYNNMDHSMENAMQLTAKLLRDRLDVPDREVRASVS
jgi:protoporphyrinogen oxidase